MQRSRELVETMMSTTRRTVVVAVLLLAVPGEIHSRNSTKTRALLLSRVLSCRAHATAGEREKKLFGARGIAVDRQADRQTETHTKTHTTRGTKRALLVMEHREQAHAQTLPFWGGFWLWFSDPDRNDATKFRLDTGIWECPDKNDWNDMKHESDL